jgi:hypothetical protein
MNRHADAREDLFTEPNINGADYCSDDDKELWSHLATHTRQQDPFCSSPNWQLSFHEAFSPQRQLIIRSGSGSLIAFAEKKFSPTNIYLTPIEPHWFFGNPLLGNNAADLLADTLIDLSKCNKSVSPKILIGGIAPEGAVFKKLKKTFRGKFDFYKISSGTQTSASLSGGIDGYLSRRSGNHRRNLKKGAAKAKRIGFSFERHKPVTAVEAKAIFERMVAVELTSWKGIGDCGMVGGSNEQFYRIMLKRLARSSDARVIFAKNEGRDIGFIFGGMAGNVYRGQQFSFDEDWRSASVGNLMQLEQIIWLCEEGAMRYDMGPFLGQGMEYKRHWTERRYQIETWEISKTREFI